MRAFQVSTAGKAPELTDLAVPDPGPDAVRVKIAACGLNFADLLMIGGTYQDTPPPPFTLGMEVSGTIDAVGTNVAALAIGDRVAVFGGHGGLAEFGVFDAARCVRIPDTIPFDVAAGFLVAYGTSHLALAHRARIGAGDRLLVLGAAGGVGLTAVELGAAMGAEVIAVARDAAKLEVARAAGAAYLIESGAPDLRDRVRALGGADVVYDTVGGDAFTAALRATNPEGRILTIGFASGDVPNIPANLLLVKNVTVHGVYWGGYMRFAPDVVTRSLDTLIGMYAAGTIRPHIGATFPLDQAAAALALLKARKSTGKVVVTM